MYTPHVGRWLSKDPSGFVDGPNQYLYVKNGPTGAVDPSGMLSQTLVACLFPTGIPRIPLVPVTACVGECGRYSWTTAFKLEQGETDGFIIQSVEQTGRTPDACNDGETPEETAPPPGTPCTTYMELWTVSQSKIYGTFPGTPNPTDTFALSGFNIATKGAITKEGFAFFIPSSAVQSEPGLAAEIAAVIKNGNASGAGTLRSACLGPGQAGIRANRLYTKLRNLRSKAGVTRKKAIMIWNCCCEKGNPDPNVLTLEVSREKVMETVKGPKQECPPC